MEIERALRLIKINYAKDVSAAKITSFMSGGNIKYIVYPKTTAEFMLTLNALDDCNIRAKTVGNCTNILVSDRGYDGAFIRLNDMADAVVDGVDMYLSAGVNLSYAANIAAENNLSGLESLTGIPARIGGALHNNAGAFGTEIGDKVYKIEVLNGDCVQILDKDSLYFKYRGGIVADKNLIVTAAWLRLKKDNKADILARQENAAKRRLSTQPSKPSAGSTFKRVNGIGAGYYIDKLKMKGYRVGGAEISRKHAGFIINRGGATTDDYIKLKNIAAEKVYKEFGLELQSEVEILDE